MDFFLKANLFECDSFKGQKKNKRRRGKFSSFWSVFAQEMFFIKALITYTVKDTSWLSHGHSENAEGAGQVGGDTLHHPLVALTSCSLFWQWSPQ